VRSDERLRTPTLKRWRLLLQLLLFELADTAEQALEV
jgi:hypothetical protein